MAVHVFVIDGPDGVGKSTLINKLVNYFNQNSSYDALAFSPSNTPYGQSIKQLLKNHRDISLDTELRLQVSTLFHLREQIIAVLGEAVKAQRNLIVFLDRWDSSTGIYQRYVHDDDGLPWYHGEKPTLPHFNKYLILDAPDDVLDERLYHRPEKSLEDKYENYAFQQKVRAGYRAIFDFPTSLHTRILVDGTPEENVRKLLSEIIPYLR